MSIPDGGVRPEWVASTNFVMIHLDLVDALGGSWEAAGLLNRIMFRAGKDGWWKATLDQMREDCRLTEHKMKRCIQELREAGMVESERVTAFDPTMRWRVVFAGEARDVPESGGINHDGDATSITVVDETSITSSLKEQEELSTKNPPTPTSLRSANGFEEWWTLWPHKVGKGAANKAYRAAVRKVGASVLYEALVVQRGILGQKRAEGFCPHPATWLNGERWADDLSAPQGPVTGFGIMRDGMLDLHQRALEGGR